MSVRAIGSYMMNVAKGFTRTTRNVAAATLIAVAPATKAVAKTEGGTIFNSAAISTITNGFSDTTAKTVAKASGGSIFNSETINNIRSSFSNLTSNVASGDVYNATNQAVQSAVSGSSTNRTNLLNTLLLKSDSRLNGTFTNTLKKVSLVLQGDETPAFCKFNEMARTNSGWSFKIETLTDKGSVINTPISVSNDSIDNAHRFFKVDIRKTSFPGK